MYNIVALFGASGAGKDYLLSRVHQLYDVTGFFRKDSLHFKISITTRPPRPAEKDGVDYIFVAEETFKKIEQQNCMVESQEFRGWFYGTSYQCLEEDKWNVGVFNISGIRQLLANKRCNVIPILITAPDKIRLIRQLSREQNPDIKEVFRRYDTDAQDFANIDFSHYVIDNPELNYQACYTDCIRGIKLDEYESVIQLANFLNMLPPIK